MPVIKRTLKILNYATLAVIGTSAVVALRNNDYDLSSLGVTRFGRAVFAATAIVIDYKWSLFGLQYETDIEKEKYISIQSQVHKRSAKRLLNLACVNGGVWIKVGQHCAALEYLLPTEYVQTLSVLHSKAPQSSFADVCRVIKEDLGLEASEIFKSIDPEPIGAASLAQVYKAVLQNDQIVALKVQHRRVKPNSFVDCTSMEFLIRCVAVLFPEFKLMWLVDEMKKNLPIELDFINEGQNTDRVRRMFAHLKFLKIPEVHWDYSSGRILLMEFCDGGQINDYEYVKKHKINPDDACRKLGQLYSEMIFLQGYVHCDPHPGNVLVYKDPTQGQQIVLLDHGLYTTLDEDFRLHYANLWLALFSRNLEQIKSAAIAMGVGEFYGLFACMVTARSWKSVMSGIDKQTVVKADESAEIKGFVSSYLPEISDVLSRVPRPMLLIFKTNDLLRGIEYALKVQKNVYSFLQMSKCCVVAIQDYEYNRCNGRLCQMKTTSRKYLSLAKILMYEWFLNMFTFVSSLRLKLFTLSGRRL